MKLRCDRKFVIFVVLIAESLCGATVTLFDLLELKNIVSDTYFHESTMVMIENR